MPRQNIHFDIKPDPQILMLNLTRQLSFYLTIKRTNL